MAQNTIYYGFLMPPATGGDFVSLDHITALRRQGLNAKAYYGAHDDGYRQFSVPVVRPCAFSPDDILVIPEQLSLAAARAIPAIKVAHNQGPYVTFYGVETVAEMNAFPLTRILVPSDFCAGMLRDMGVRHPISRVRPALPDYFAPLPKRLAIAYSPNKRPREAAFLQGYFRSKFPALAHVPWIKLQGLTRQAGAEAMAGAAIYAGFPLLEGLGLMNLEAMAGGCHVVSYVGQGGAEYATDENGDWIAEGDHAAFVEKLAEACRLFESGAVNPRIAAGRATAAKFSPANFESELTAAWAGILGDKSALYRL